MAEIIEWKDDRRKLSDLVPWERNPRQITNAQAERLVDSVNSFGQVETLIIACENLQRQCRAIEISPAYCAVILERYVDHTGLEPELIDA